MTVSTCRFCGKCNYDDSRFELIKYGVRHYAHPDCALAKLGAAFFDRLSLWQLNQFPYKAAQEEGLLPDLQKLIDDKRERAGEFVR